MKSSLWKPAAKGPAFTGLSTALSQPPLDMKKLPFNPLEYIEHIDTLPFFNGEADLK